jgi:hypothetical protein
MLQINQRVKKISQCYYSHAGDNSNIPIGAIGTIVRIRSRYIDTPNEYHLYIVKFDNNNFDDNSLDSQYDETSLELI